MSYVTLEQERIRVENIYCIGRNYLAHAKEMGAERPEVPVVFLKPTSSIVHAPGPIELPAHSSEVHYEGEIVLLIGKGGANIPEAEALKHIRGIGLGLDLTARDVQATAKKKGLPWAAAKGFQTGACVSEFIALEDVKALDALEFELLQNGERRQLGKVENMLFSLNELIAYLSSVFSLAEGDLIYTGTPEGVGPIASGDTLELRMQEYLSTRFTVG